MPRSAAVENCDSDSLYLTINRCGGSAKAFPEISKLRLIADSAKLLRDLKLDLPFILFSKLFFKI